MQQNIQAKFGPERAQAKFPETLRFMKVFLFNLFAYFLALAALHWASLLHAPLAKIGKQKQVCFMLFCYHLDGPLLSPQEAISRNP